MPAPFQSRHRRLVLHRMRALSRVLAVLTIAWIPIDALWLGAGFAISAAPLRVVLALALWAWSRVCERFSIGLAVNGFVWLQAIGFTALQAQVDTVPASAMQLGYGLFPFLLTAQLALLALPWPRTLLAGLAPAAQLALLLMMQPTPASEAWSHAWLFGLILLLATWTGDAQRRLLVDLLDARHDAAHDPLTGLANRRSAEDRLEASRAEALRYDAPLAVLALDLDRFKRINDRHGHAAGDRVLQAVGHVLHDALRGGDLGARHGGEEFLVILPHCACDQAFDTAERIRRRVAALRVPIEGDSLRITVSIGIACLAGDEPVAALLFRADAALYAAKAQGRNRCVVANARPDNEFPLEETSDTAYRPSIPGPPDVRLPRHVPALVRAAPLRRAAARLHRLGGPGRSVVPVARAGVLCAARAMRCRDRPDARPVQLAIWLSFLVPWIALRVVGI